MDAPDNPDVPDTPEAADAPDADLFEEQRRVYDLLSQETRHLVLQHVLGHPAHLPSLGELDYVIPKSASAIGDQLDALVDAGMLAVYVHEPSEDARDLPSRFYGLTERGVSVLREHGYLRGLPVARARYDDIRKSERVERHESAPRPDLPDAVEAALTLDGSCRDDDPGSVEARIERLLLEILELAAGPDDEELTLEELADDLGLDADSDIESDSASDFDLDSGLDPDSAFDGDSDFAIDVRALLDRLD
jgi:DNA-binding transcriptional ArsR family regulator